MATLVCPLLLRGHHSFFGCQVSIHCNRYVTRYSCPDKRFCEFLNSTHLSINKKKTLGSFGFDVSTVWKDLPDDVHSVPTLACFRKYLESYRFKMAFPPKSINYPPSPPSRPGNVYGIIIIELLPGVAP